MRLLWWAAPADVARLVPDLHEVWLSLLPRMPQGSSGGALLPGGEQMTAPTTLGEVLDKWEGKGRATFGQTGGAIHAFTQDLRRILYGIDEPCPECETSGVGSPPADGRPYGPVCPTCHELRGTGRIKTPGLVERVAASALAEQEFTSWRVALRREIREATP